MHFCSCLEELRHAQTVSAVQHMQAAAKQDDRLNTLACLSQTISMYVGSNIDNLFADKYRPTDYQGLSGQLC